MPSSPTSDAGIQDAARHLAQGRPAEAAAVLERIVSHTPAYVTAHVLLAKAREADGRPLDALDAWHDAYFLMPGSPLVVRERTRLLRTAPVPDTSTEPAAPAPIADAPTTPESSAEPEAHIEPEARSVTAEPESKPEPPTDPEVEGGSPFAVRSESVAAELDPDMLMTELPPAADAPTSDDGEDESEAPDAPIARGLPPEVADVAERGDTLEEADDLDSLIHELENAPRIRPDPSFKDAGLEEEDDEDDGIVSETLARIYAAQRQFAAAARAYDQLADLHPARAEEFEAKAAEMRDLAASES